MKINYNDAKGNDRIADLNEIISITPSCTDKYAFEQTFRFDLTRSLFVPNWCYKKILKPNGSSDEYGIHILSELMNLQYLYGTDGVDYELHNSYTHFWEKFFFKKPRVQRATARLEESGLVSRTFVATSLVRDAKIAKELTLKLNHAKLLTLVEDCEVDL